MPLVPMVVEQLARGERAADILLAHADRASVFFGTPIDDEVANLIVAEIIHLQSEDPDKDISLWINSPGGGRLRGPGDLRRDAVVRPDVRSIRSRRRDVDGRAAADRRCQGKRMALPNSRIRIHQPVGRPRRPAPDIEIDARETLEARRRRSTRSMPSRPARPRSAPTKTGRDRFFTAADAVDYGLVDG